jgi:hypothetical protein
MAEGKDPAPKDRDKLILVKQAWAKAGRLLTGAPGDPAHGCRRGRNW